MSTPSIRGLLLLAPLLLVAVRAAAESPTTGPALDQRVDALKKSVAASQAAIKAYEWVETTVVSVKGEEKSRTMQRCYYGEDGVLQKTPIASEQEGKTPRGIRGKIVERKKEELTDYMKEAIALVRLYVPPDPAQIQKCASDGKASAVVVEPGKRVRLEFKDYRVSGDVLGITLNMADDTLAAVNVASSLGKEKDTVSLVVTCAKLNETITYASNMVLEAKAKDLKVEVTNTGYVKLKK